MTAFAIVLVIAAVFVWSLCVSAGRADERMERINADFELKRRNQNETDSVLAEIPEMPEGTIDEGSFTGGESGADGKPGPAAIGRGEGAHREIVPIRTAALPCAGQTRGAGVRTRRETMIPAWPVFVLIAFIIGGVAGWTVRLHAANDRFQTTMAAKYRAQQAWLDAQTTAMMADVERDIAAVKSQIKKKTREVKRNGK